MLSDIFETIVNSNVLSFVIIKNEIFIENNMVNFYISLC